MKTNIGAFVSISRLILCFVFGIILWLWLIHHVPIRNGLTNTPRALRFKVPDYTNLRSGDNTAPKGSTTKTDNPRTFQKQQGQQKLNTDRAVTGIQKDFMTGDKSEVKSQSDAYHMEFEAIKELYGRHMEASRYLNN